VKNQEWKSGLISPPLLMSGGGFYLDLRIRKDGYAWAAWRMVICLCRMRLLGDDGAIDGVERRDIDEGRRERWR
jgi:hypothetical protein